MSASKETVKLHLSRKIELSMKTACIAGCLFLCGTTASVLRSKYSTRDVTLELSGRRLDDSKCKPSDKSDWTYNYGCTAEDDSQVAPDVWFTVYPDCGGDRQSPVNLALSDISGECSQATITGPFEYTSAKCSYDGLIPNPSYKAWEIGFDPEACEIPPSFMVNGKTYALLQFHLHSVSEHTVDNGYYDAELHMVHLNINDPADFIVLGMFLSVNSGSDDDTEINKYLTLLTKKPNDSDSEMTDEFVNPYTLLPADNTFFTYLGSLTNPPCLEVVTWVVFSQPVLISADELNTLRDGYAKTKYTLADSDGNNARPVQDLGDRIVYQCP